MSKRLQLEHKIKESKTRRGKRMMRMMKYYITSNKM